MGVKSTPIWDGLDGSRSTLRQLGMTYGGGQEIAKIAGIAKIGEAKLFH
jgi:hypothetical protein